MERIRAADDMPPVLQVAAEQEARRILEQSQIEAMACANDRPCHRPQTAHLGQRWDEDLCAVFA
jgi:hypothetical protein